MAVRGVRVALHVGEGVVLSMVGDPVDHRALHRHRAEDGERVADPGLRLERAMGEEAVVPDRDPERGRQVHGEEDREVGRADQVVPEEDDREAETDEGEDDGGEGDVALKAAHARRFPVAGRCGYCRRSRPSRQIS